MKKEWSPIVGFLLLGIIWLFIYSLLSHDENASIPAPKMNIEDSSTLRSWTEEKRQEVANMARNKSREDQKEIAKLYNISLYELDILLK